MIKNKFITAIILILIILLIITVCKKLLRVYCYNFWQMKNSIKYYNILFDQVESDSKILDIGVGTCNNLVKNKNQIIKKELKIHGIDIDKDYNDYCKECIEYNDLEKDIKIEFRDLFDINNYYEYDYAIFGQSFPVIPRNIMTNMLDHAKKLIKQDGKIIFIHQLDDQDKLNHIYYKIKKIIKYIPFVWIDSGIPTSKKEFENWLENNNLKYENKIIHTDKVFGLDLNIYMYTCIKNN